LLGRRQQTAGEEDCSGKAVPEAPEPLMADIRLQAIKRQDDPALGLGNPLEAGRVRQREREQCVVAFTQMRGRPRGDRDAPLEPERLEILLYLGRKHLYTTKNQLEFPLQRLSLSELVTLGFDMGDALTQASHARLAFLFFKQALSRAIDEPCQALAELAHLAL